MQKLAIRLFILSLIGLMLVAGGCGSPPSTDIAQGDRESDTPTVPPPTTAAESSTPPAPIASLTPRPTDTPIAPPPPTASPTPAPTDTPLAPPPPPPSPEPSDTPIAPPPPPGPPPPPSCQVPVYDGFQGISNVDWKTLGCPSAALSSNVMMAKEGFEGGQMIWREDAGQIYVRYNSGSWAGFYDTWSEDQPEYSCPNIGTISPPVPKRGFGKVWCEHPVVRNQLGWALNEEQGFHGNIQDFLTGGHIIQMDTGRIFVLYPTGAWVDR